MEKITNTLISVNPEEYSHVKCRRIGVTLDWFSCVRGRHLFSGITSYVSKKNYRSNEEFAIFKANNPLRARILIVGTDSTFRQDLFKDDNDLFTSPNFNYDADIVVFSNDVAKFKVKKSKLFYVKCKMGMIKDEKGKFFLVDNVTFEMTCNLE